MNQKLPPHVLSQGFRPLLKASLQLKKAHLQPDSSFLCRNSQIVEYQQHFLCLRSIQALRAYSPYNFSTEIFVWTDGYPGELTDPAEGEGALDELTFTSGTLATDADAVEDGDEVHNLYTLKLTNGGVKLNLELIGDEVVGTYTIESDPVAAGKAVAGYYDGAQKNGCYLDLSVTKYYLTSGEITIAEDAENPGTYTVNVTAKSATDVDVVASFTGELPAPSPAPGKPKTLKRINL